MVHKAACHTLSNVFLEPLVQTLPMLKVLCTQDSKVEDLCEPSLFFSNYLFSLGFITFQDDFQHVSRVTDETDSPVVLTEL